MEPVVIRTREQLHKMNPDIVGGLMNLTHTDRHTPMIYQYLHSREKSVEIKPDITIGEIYNVRKDKNGNIIGDVKLFFMNRLSVNYQHTIDNLIASIHPETNSIEVDAFIVYDKEAKELVRERRRSAASPKPGRIPLVSGIDPVTMKEITDTLVEEYNKLVEGQQSDKTKEDQYGQ